MAKPEKQQTVTKKHMARQEREALQTRKIMYVSIALLVVVLALVGYALIDAYVLTPNRAVAVVNGEKISTTDYQARVRFERSQLVTQFGNTLQLMQSFEDESTMQYFQNSLQQINMQLTPELHGQTVLNNMIDDELIRQGAAELGISVNESEVDEYIAKAFGYFPNGTPTPAPTSAPLATSTLSPQQLTLVPQLPAEEAPEDTSEIEEAPAQDTAGEELPTPTAYTQENFEEDYQETIKGYKQSVNISEAQFRSFIRSEILRKKVLDEVSKDISTEEEQVWARHILVDTEDEAKIVVNRLADGEDFAALAIELSKDTGSGVNGGDLGWFGRGQMVPAFEEAAFDLEIGQVSTPIQTTYGFHIIQKLGGETRPIDDATYNQMQQTELTRWLAEQREASDVQSDETWKTVYPETPAIPPEYLSFIGM